MARLLTLLIMLAVLHCSSDCCYSPPAATGDPLVVFTFDDGFSSIYSFAYAAMKKVNSSWTATHFLPASYPGNPGMVTLDQLREMERGGWETGGHGDIHRNLSAVPLWEADSALRKSREWLQEAGLSHSSFAFAWGNYNNDVLKKAAHYFDNIRTSHDLHYRDGVDRKHLGCFDVLHTHTTADVIARITEARIKKAPLVVLCFHAVLPDSTHPAPAYYWCKESVFTGLLSYLSGAELTVCSVQDAMDLLAR